MMNLDAALTLLAGNPSAPLDLAELALQLAHDEYPDLDVEAYLNEIAGMAHEARALLHGDLAARVHGLCRYLFHDMGFRGNLQTYYDARNSYFNEVLDRRTGIPISLSAVAMTVGARAGLHIVGVGLPGHFIVKAIDDEEEVLFDPFHGGRVLTPEQCETLVEQVTGMPFAATDESLREVPLGFIVVRMLTNLKAVYLREGDFPRGVRIIERLRQLVPNDPLHQRDLGAALFQAGRHGSAIGPLSAYLRLVPQADDRDTVAQLLAQAKVQVARWN
jgi:regulator of sirC expression with transglutaminase-like and TPR domain